jgi:hypothetical protein
MDIDYDDYYDAQGEWEAQLIKDGIREQSRDRVRDYLATYGGAVESRINMCLEQARKLLGEHPHLAVSLACTAAELTVRYLILRPLIQGALFSRAWEGILIRRMLGQRSASDRELFPAVLRAEGIEVSAAKLDDGREIWPLFVTSVVPLRNNIAHKGASAGREQGVDAIVCAEHMLSLIVTPLAMRVGLSWSKSGVWHRIEQGVGGATFSMTYKPADPFV